MESYKNIYEYISANQYSTLINVISTFLGAFLGFFFAWCIYRLGERSQRKNDELAKRINAYNVLQRFSLILDSVVRNSKKQSEYYELYSKNLHSNPFEYLIPDIGATYDVERLVNSDSLELFQSFLIFEKANSISFKDYREIFKHADFLKTYFADLFIQIQKHHEYFYSDSKIIRNNLLIITTKLVIYANKIYSTLQSELPSNKIELQFINKFIDVNRELKKSNPSNLEQYRNLFFMPFANEFYSHFTNQFMIDEIAYPLTESITLLENIELNVNNHSENFSNTEKETEDAIKYLMFVIDKISKIKAH
jgi:hypothetical protein